MLSPTASMDSGCSAPRGVPDLSLNGIVCAESSNTVVGLKSGVSLPEERGCRSDARISSDRVRSLLLVQGETKA